MLGLAVAARVDADHAKRRILGEHIEEGEWRAVGDAVLAPGGDPGDWPGNHQADEELVALVRRNLVEAKVHQFARVYTWRSREASSGTASARYFLECAVCWCTSNA